MATYLQGDIVLVPFPFSDDFESPKVRPAIIISNSLVNKPKDVILVKIASDFNLITASLSSNKIYSLMGFRII